ncbi:hypothetical protein DQ04_09291020 [Trypanosoma grayi]|uniref:hypothetical protein n=1 Tax=Trypanosoma grayi TaxID=71804 RepID=UPI0004F4BE58|nr:hypothetical protein DQ04_09291020 [Trypanosoma grayi]KEG07610.1 hypothetical protein DQ04_09291020 [Trypanosoma grayi]
MQPAGSCNGEPPADRPNGLSDIALTCLILIGFIAVGFLLMCGWLKCQFGPRSLWLEEAAGAYYDSGSTQRRNQQQEQAQEQEPTTLPGQPLENRVRMRRGPLPHAYYLPDGHTVVHIDDPNKIPEAAPPPPTEEELQRQREEAERIASPVLYGRGMYLNCSIVTCSDGSFCYPNTPVGRVATHASFGSLILARYRTKDENLCGAENNDGVSGDNTGCIQRPREPFGTPIPGSEKDKQGEEG